MQEVLVSNIQALLTSLVFIQDRPGLLTLCLGTDFKRTYISCEFCTALSAGYALPLPFHPEASCQTTSTPFGSLLLAQRIVLSPLAGLS